MRGGRDADHHAQALSLRRAAVAWALAALAGVSPAGASEQQKLAATGTVHRVQSAVTSNGPGSGSAILHRAQLPDGTVTSEIIPGTEDARPDAEPVLEIDPVTQRPIVVWARDTDGDFDIFVTRLEASGWGPLRSVGALAGQDRSPRVKVTPQWVHIVWRNELPLGPQPYRLTLERATLKVAYGPEPLPLDDADPISPAGETATSPPNAGLFFAVPLTSVITGASPRVFLWGIQEEPTPVGYLETFEVPPGVTDLGRADAGWFGGRFAVWFVTRDKLFYTYQEGGAWTGMRQMQLDTSTPESEAVGQLREMLLRPRASE